MDRPIDLASGTDRPARAEPLAGPPAGPGVTPVGEPAAAGRGALDAVRQAVRDIERRGLLGNAAKARGGAVNGLPFGITALDSVLPDGGLPLAAVHEVGAAAAGHAGAASGFLCAMLARLQRVRDGVVLWCQRCDVPGEAGGLYGPGLAAFGLDPARLVMVRLRRAEDVLWAMREGLASEAGIAAVVGEGAEPDLTAWRRLQLAAEETGVCGFVLRAAPSQAAESGGMASRWAVCGAASGPVPGLPPALGCAPGLGPGRPCWHVQLTRCRGGAQGGWYLEWHHETSSFKTGDFAMVAALPDGSVEPAAIGVAR